MASFSLTHGSFCALMLRVVADFILKIKQLAHPLSQLAHGRIPLLKRRQEAPISLSLSFTLV